MSNRLMAAILWFAAVWVGYEIVWSVAGVPRIVGPLLATVVAAFVALDPLGVYFARPTRRSVVSDQPARALPTSR
ncbi:MAG: hypothetical protein H0U52_16810 [Chloroflexi bacterium]|nr:hypothetical protein [Chloroflexota bacterium]